LVPSRYCLGLCRPVLLLRLPVCILDRGTDPALFRHLCGQAVQPLFPPLSGFGQGRPRDIRVGLRPLQLVPQGLHQLSVCVSFTLQRFDRAAFNG
jgi:hypothetical protein